MMFYCRYSPSERKPYCWRGSPPVGHVASIPISHFKVTRQRTLKRYNAGLTNVDARSFTSDLAFGKVGEGVI